MDNFRDAAWVYSGWSGVPSISSGQMPAEGGMMGERMDERDVRLWFIVHGAGLLIMIMAGLFFGSWREGELALRFRLGTLMIGIAMVAVLLWLAVSALRTFVPHDS
jgi:hypothetical protein